MNSLHLRIVSINHGYMLLHDTEIVFQECSNMMQRLCFENFEEFLCTLKKIYKWNPAQENMIS